MMMIDFSKYFIYNNYSSYSVSQDRKIKKLINGFVSWTPQWLISLESLVDTLYLNINDIILASIWLGYNVAHDQGRQ